MYKDPKQAIRTVLLRIDEVLSKKELVKEDHSRIHALRKELCQVVWRNRDSVFAALKAWDDYRDNPRLSEFVELGLLGKPDAGGVRVVEKDGKKVRRYANDVYFLDSRTSIELAQATLREQDGPLRRLELIALRTHSWSLDWKEKPYLEPAILADLLGLWTSLGLEKGASGQSAQDYLLMTVGPYEASNEKVRGFLEQLARNPMENQALKATALRELSRGDVTLSRLALAEFIFTNEKDQQIRRNAIELVSTWISGPVNDALKSRSFQILERIAREDPDGEVRSSAGQALMELHDAKALDAVENILRKEKQADVRARILRGFRWATFFNEHRDQLHAAQDLTVRVFQRDSDEEVKRAAVGAYLDLVWRTLWVNDESGTSFDPRGMDSIKKMVAAIQKREMSRETKQFIRKKLEEDFEKRIPELSGVDEYQELKDFLGK